MFPLWFIKDDLIVFSKQKFRKLFKVGVCDCLEITADFGTRAFQESVNQNFASCHSNPSRSQLEMLCSVITSTTFHCFRTPVLKG